MNEKGLRRLQYELTLARDRASDQFLKNQLQGSAERIRQRAKRLVEIEELISVFGSRSFP